MNKFKKKLYIAFATSLLIIFMFAYLSLGKSKKEEFLPNKNPELVNYFAPRQYIKSLMPGIERIKIKQNLNDIPVEKLNFYWPKDSAYNADPAFGVYNPLGGQVTPPNENVDGAWKAISKNKRLIYSISNKVIGVGTNKTELIAILADVSRESCEALNRNDYANRNDKIPKVSFLNLTPLPLESNESDVVVLERRSACVQLPDGKNYYYDVLVDR